MKTFAGFSRTFTALALGAAFVSAAALGGSSALPASATTPTTVLGYDIDSASSLTVVVNKTRPLTPVTYGPAQFGAVNLAKPAADAFARMRHGMAKAGDGDLYISSGYRGYYSQRAIYRRDVAKLGLLRGQRLAAKPGYSEHQTGLAADLAAYGQGCVVKVCFSTTKASAWLVANSWRYGFILRYPQGQTKITGYQFEPWHYRFVGKTLSIQMHKAKATVLETFLGLPAAPDYIS